MVTDHKQSFRTDENLTEEERKQTPPAVLWRNEEIRRAEMRQLWFPDLMQYVDAFTSATHIFSMHTIDLSLFLLISIK